MVVFRRLDKKIKKYKMSKNNGPGKKTAIFIDEDGMQYKGYYTEYEDFAKVWSKDDKTTDLINGLKTPAVIVTEDGLPIDIGHDEYLTPENSFTDIMLDKIQEQKSQIENQQNEISCLYEEIQALKSEISSYQPDNSILSVHITNTDKDPARVLIQHIEG